MVLPGPSELLQRLQHGYVLTAEQLATLAQERDAAAALEASDESFRLAAAAWRAEKTQPAHVRRLGIDASCTEVAESPTPRTAAACRRRVIAAAVSLPPPCHYRPEMRLSMSLIMNLIVTS